MSNVNNPSVSTESNLIATSDTKGVPSGWDWKSWYVERMANGAGNEMFSEESITPDTTLFLAGPPLMATDGFTEMLHPLGLVNNVSISTDNQLRPLWEIGNDKTYFTRGKSINTMQISAMVANKPSLMKLLSRSSPTHTDEYISTSQGQFWADADREIVNKPFGILALFASKSTTDQTSSGVKMISSVYIENCNIGSFNFSIGAQDLFMQENVSIMFDRMIDVDYGAHDPGTSTEGATL